MHSFGNSISNHYYDFKGRATREEYWMYMAFIFGLLFVLYLITTILGDLALILMGPLVVVAFALFLPTLAIQARRLHDIGRSGWWCLLLLLPVPVDILQHLPLSIIVLPPGAIVLMVMSTFPSKSGTNKYGPNAYETLAVTPPMPPTPPQGEA
jgi:uncharacterized membrane protein YhaH (DUF805 family)